MIRGGRSGRGNGRRLGPESREFASETIDLFICQTEEKPPETVNAVYLRCSLAPSQAQDATRPLSEVVGV